MFWEILFYETLEKTEQLSSSGINFCVKLGKFTMKPLTYAISASLSNLSYSSHGSERN